MLIIVAIIAVAYVWYSVYCYNHIPDNTLLILDGEQNKIFDIWDKPQVTDTFNLDISHEQIAAKLLSRLYNIDLDPELLTIGENIHNEYTRLTGEKLPPGPVDEGNCLFNLRDIIGASGEIAIIHDSQVRQDIYRDINYDAAKIDAIITQQLDLPARDYLRDILKYRWGKLTQVGYSNLINDQGSYAYVRNIEIPNVQMAEIDGGKRINLLCSDPEFEALIKRWKNLPLLSTL